MQGILAPVQFLAFAVSLVLVLRFLSTGEGYEAATVSILVKTGFLYTDHGDRRDLGKGGLRPVPLRPRLLLGRRVQFRRHRAAHRCIFVALLTGALTPHALMLLALAAYATYVINAGQFI